MNKSIVFSSVVLALVMVVIITQVAQAIIPFHWVQPGTEFNYMDTTFYPFYPFTTYYIKNSPVNNDCWWEVWERDLGGRVVGTADFGALGNGSSQGETFPGQPPQAAVPALYCSAGQLFVSSGENKSPFHRTYVPIVTICTPRSGCWYPYSHSCDGVYNENGECLMEGDGMTVEPTPEEEMLVNPYPDLEY